MAANMETAEQTQTKAPVGAETKAEQEYSLEELFAQAEELISHLEEPQLPLEEAFAAYEQGMKVIARCNGKIDCVEKKMLMMDEDGGLSSFDATGERQ